MPVDVTDSMQSICEQCTGSKHVSFRHLSGTNGSFLCDSCYRILFPATAMFEASQSSGFIRNTITAISSAVSRRVEKLTKYENEEEECHKCLEKGTFQKCCNKFYCRTCYFRFSKCPGCNTPCHRSGVTEAMSLVVNHPPSVLAVLSSWVISISLMVGIFIIIIVLSLNLTAKKQKTVWNHTCRGWWWQEQCDIPVCIDLNYINSSSSAALSDYFPSDYIRCRLNETNIQVLGNACVFDNELYRRSGQKLGFDVCIEREAGSKAFEVSAMPLAPKFDHQVVIFEDTFDYWLDPINFNSSVSVAAKWNSTMNAKAADICGYSEQSLEYEQYSSATQTFPARQHSLLFSGVNERYAETQDLNLEFGGSLQFQLKFAPIVDNELTVTCKTAFSGDASLKYSLNHGITWETWRNYPVWKYRSENFIFIKEILPDQAWSRSVRFKWEQEEFDPQRDYWAMDNLRIFHHFNSSWRSNIAYDESFEVHHNKVSIDQCCFDSDQCLDFPNDTNICVNFRTFHFHSIHLYVISAYCILFVRKILKDSRVKRIHPEKGVTKVVPIETDVCRSFQVFAVCCSVTPQISVLAFVLQNVLSNWGFYAGNTLHFGFIVLMVTLDFLSLRFVCLHVFRFWPFQLSPEVYLTATDEDVNLFVNEDIISIADIKSIENFSQRTMQYLIASSILTTMPISSIMILIKILKAPYFMSYVLMHLLGTLILLRSILGPLWFVRMHLSLTWILTLSSTKRDSMGRALQRPFIHHISAKTALIFICSINAMLIVRSWGKMHINGILIQTFLALAGGIIIGSIIGMLRYLPVTCTSNSLLLTAWPHQRFSFSAMTGDRDSMKFHILSLKDDSLLRSILDGSIDINSISSESNENNE